MAIRIFIDQGHNPRNPNGGAEANGLLEQDITYAVGVSLGELLAADPNFEVRLSRNSPDQQLGTSNATSLQTRVQMANSWPADYFLSIHCNASENTAASGSEVYVYREPSEAYNLGTWVLEGLAAETGLPNRGMRVSTSYYVLRKTAMPALLVEMGYLTNPGDAALMSARPDLFARGIYRGLLAYFDL